MMVINEMISIADAISQKEHFADIEANLLARFVYLSQSSRMRLRLEPEISWFTTDITYPHYLFNIVLRANFAGREMAQTQIDQLIRDARSRRTSLFWCVGPATYPVDLGYYLRQRRFIHALTLMAMRLDLAMLNETSPTIPDFKVVRVETISQLKEFIMLQAHNNGLSPGAAEAWFNLEAAIGLGDHLSWQRYLGYRYGKAVAAASTVAGAGVVGLYQVATLPQMRGLGLGTAVSLAALQDARQRGHSQAVLHSTPLGLNVYRRLGFKSVTIFDIYLWPEPNTEI